MKESLEAAHKFQLWKRNLLASGLEIHNIEEVFSKYRHNGEVLFSLVLLDATTPEGDKIPPICFIKGEVVSVLIALIDEDTGEKYLLLVRQRRICNGDFVYEHVAGMVDGSDDPLDVAIREASEEAGIELTKDQMHLLNPEPHYPSTGTCDEAMFYYYCELTLPKEQIMSYNEQEQGVVSEHERIITHVVPIKKAMGLMNNPNGALIIYMYLDAIGKGHTWD